jgi:membrane protein
MVLIGSVPRPMQLWGVLKAATRDWFHDRCPRMGAALAYYSVFSMGPLLLIVTAVAGLFLGPDAVRGRLTDQFRSLLGDLGAQAIEAMLAGAAGAQTGRFAAVTGFALLIVAAIGVVVQLKDAMNTIWRVKDPEETTVWLYIRTYIASLLGVLALGFLLTVSLVVSSVLAALTEYIGLFAPFLDFAASLAVLTALFAMLFKWFPDASIAWRDVWLGALITALLFNVGKLLIGWYVGTQGVASTYGAAGSIVVLLIWVYYSAQIVLFGAEFTHAYAKAADPQKS